MSTNVPGMDIHLAISNLKSRLCLYVCVWGGAVLGVTMHIQAIQMGVGRLEARREKVGYVEFYYKTP